MIGKGLSASLRRNTASAQCRHKVPTKLSVLTYLILPSHDPCHGISMKGPAQVHVLSGCFLVVPFCKLLETLGGGACLFIGSMSLYVANIPPSGFSLPQWSHPFFSSTRFSHHDAVPKQRVTWSCNSVTL